MPYFEVKETGPIYAINHEAEYWRTRALAAEAKLEETRAELDESINTGVAFARTSSNNILHAIMGGAFDKKPPVETE